MADRDPRLHRDRRSRPRADSLSSRDSSSRSSSLSASERGATHRPAATPSLSGEDTARPRPPSALPRGGSDTTPPQCHPTATRSESGLPPRPADKDSAPSLPMQHLTAAVSDTRHAASPFQRSDIIARSPPAPSPRNLRPAPTSEPGPSTSSAARPTPPKTSHPATSGKTYPKAASPPRDPRPGAAGAARPKPPSAKPTTSPSKQRRARTPPASPPPESTNVTSAFPPLPTTQSHAPLPGALSPPPSTHPSPPSGKGPLPQRQPSKRPRPEVASTASISPPAKRTDLSTYAEVSANARPTGTTPMDTAPQSAPTGPAPPPPQEPRYPPLVVEKLENWVQHFKCLKEILGHAPNAKPYKEGVRFTPRGEQEYRSIQKYLSGLEGVSWYSYSLPQEQGLKVGIIGLPLGTTAEEVHQGLVDLGYVVEQVSKIKTTSRTGEPKALFFALLTRTPDLIPGIYKLDELLYMPGIRVEAWRGRSGPPQCHRCQQFWHSSKGCHRPLACVRCTGEHYAEQCPLPRTEKPTCANCKGEHPANNRSCPAFRKEARRIQSRTATRPAPPRRNFASQDPPIPDQEAPPPPPSATSLMAEANDPIPRQPSSAPKAKARKKKKASAINNGEATASSAAATDSEMEPLALPLPPSQSNSVPAAPKPQRTPKTPRAPRASHPSQTRPAQPMEVTEITTESATIPQAVPPTTNAHMPPPGPPPSQRASRPPRAHRPRRGGEPSTMDLLQALFSLAVNAVRQIQAGGDIFTTLLQALPEGAQILASLIHIWLPPRSV